MVQCLSNNDTGNLLSNFHMTCNPTSSFSSFELSSVYRLTTQFNPLFMASLLIAKNLIPWMAVVMPFVAFMKLRGQVRSAAALPHRLFMPHFACGVSPVA